MYIVQSEDALWGTHTRVNVHSHAYIYKWLDWLGRQWLFFFLFFSGRPAGYRWPLPCVRLSSSQILFYTPNTLPLKQTHHQLLVLPSFFSLSLSSYRSLLLYRIVAPTDMSQGSCDCVGLTCLCQPAYGTNSLGETVVLPNQEPMLFLPSPGAPIQRLVSLDTPFPGDKPPQLFISNTQSTANTQFMLNSLMDCSEIDTKMAPPLTFSEKGATSRALKSIPELKKWNESHSLMVTSPLLLWTVDPHGGLNFMEKMSTNFVAQNRVFVNREELKFLSNSVVAQDVTGKQACLYLDLFREHNP